MIYLSSDLHFGHNKNFLYEPRGFSSIDAHDENIVKNINTIVKPDDTLYILGDCALGNLAHGLECLKALNGKKYLVVGNHDTDSKIATYRKEGIFQDIQYGYRFTYKKIVFLLSHYPTFVGEFKENKKFHLVNLCGHTHAGDPLVDWTKGAIYHCELDAHGNAPVSLDYVIYHLNYCFG